MPNESARIERKATRFEFKFTEKAGKGCFEGYASTFNQEDDGGDLIVSGAFTQTLAEYNARGSAPKMLLNHGGLGSWMSSPAPEDLLPIGKWTNITEDTHGLPVEGKLINLDTEHGKRIYGAMKEEALDAMSIGYQAKQFVRGTKANEPQRTLQRVHLIEISPVTFPANSGAIISSVKSLDFTDLKSVEGFLRDACGFSRSDATGFLARVKSLLQSESAGGDDEMMTQNVLAALRRQQELLRA